MKQKAVFAAVALLASGILCSQNLPELPQKDGFDIRGYVYAESKGVPDVWVTDGVTFAKTDENGAYYLKSSDGAKFVSVVLPSGYELHPRAVNGGVQHFYTEFSSTDADFQAYFELVPIGDDKNFTFLVHADTQPEPYFNSNVYAELGKGYADMQASAVAAKAKDGFMPFNLHLGDIVYNTPTQERDYENYLATLAGKGYNTPLFVTPGNHDRQYRLDYDKAMKYFHPVWGPTYYAFDRGNVHFIVMDNVYISKEGDYTRGFHGKQLVWLQNYLNVLPKGSKIVLCAHQPLTRNDAAIKSFGSMLDMLKGYDVMLLTGHLHRQFNNFPRYADGIRERNHVALGGYEWRAGGVSQDGVPWGYYIYSVSNGNISWKYKPIGQDADKSLFRLYTPGQFTDYEPLPSETKTVKINVWDWDEDWKVTWSLDGVEQGDVQRYDSHLDPRASYNYDGIATQPTWKAIETYHILYCTVPPTGSVVKVTATDPFGRSMSKTIEVESDRGGIEAIAPESCGVDFTEVYSLQGVRLLEVAGYPEADTLPVGKGIYLLRLHHTDGSVTTEKTVL